MNNIKYFIFAAALAIIDQLSKWIVTENILRPFHYDGATGLDFLSWYAQAPDRLPYIEMPLLPFFNLVMVWNDGISFGMLTQSTSIGTIILIALTIIITIVFGMWLTKTTKPLLCLSMAMVIGGAIGNVTDRIRFGGVIDFLDLHAFGWHYPAFNIADSAIVVGTLILMVYWLFFEKTVQD